MPTKNYLEILSFSKIISGKYSNKRQSDINPRLFAHINLFFIPIKWNIMNGPGFYSEQSFAHRPWSPYRQALHKLESKGDTFILQNFQIINSKRLAGAGFNKYIFNNLIEAQKKLREGCEMHFKQIETNSYKGNVQPGEKCLINRNGKISYLISNVSLNKKQWISEDQGIEIKSNKKVWGSTNGPIIFDKIERFDEEINLKWLYG